MNDLSFIESRILHTLRQCAKKVAQEFDIKYNDIFVFKADDPDRKTCAGMYYDDGTIYINVKETKLKYATLESLLDTLVHELTHTEYHTHSKEFWKRHKLMKRWLWKELY